MAGVECRPPEFELPGVASDTRLEIVRFSSIEIIRYLAFQIDTNVQAALKLRMRSLQCSTDGFLQA